MRRTGFDTLSQVCYAGFMIAGLLEPYVRSDKRREAVGRTVRTADNLASSYLLVSGLKSVIPAKRPDSGEQNSFPSKHALNSFAVASSACGEGPREWCWWYGAAATIGLLRVVARRHRMRDVL